MARYSIWILLLCVGLLCIGHGLHGSLVAVLANAADFGPNALDHIQDMRLDAIARDDDGYLWGHTVNFPTLSNHCRVFASYEMNPLRCIA